MTMLFLVGARAAGKTTIGRTLAKNLGLPFVDTDQFLLHADGRTVDQIVAQEGWPGFRARESATLHEVAQAHAAGCVVATGGGIVLAEENRDFMRGHGMVVYLEAPVGVLTQRLGRNPLNSQRPSLTGRGLLEEMAQVLEERQPLYHAAAHHIVDASRSQAEICRRIQDFWQAWRGGESAAAPTPAADRSI